MKYLWKRPANPKLFGGSVGSHDAELSDKTIEELRLRPALTRLAKALADRYKGYGREPTQYSDGSEVIGIDIHSIGFSLVTQSIPRR